ncbi:MAG: hypothetical protein Q8M23_00300 [Bacteroidales bacterium]|nr:hypothetical protein [Bacteroidales bacterium]
MHRDTGASRYCGSSCGGVTGLSVRTLLSRAILRGASHTACGKGSRASSDLRAADRIGC